MIGRDSVANVKEELEDNPIRLYQSSESAANVSCAFFLPFFKFTGEAH